MELLHQEITDKILRAFYNVYNELGYGFLEKVYGNALFYELSSLGFDCKTQHPIDVYYFDKKVGQYFADIVINDRVVVELKATESICEEHEYQLLNYLKATNIEVGLLLNFGKKPGHKRKIFMNTRKSFMR
jgi:GxxExxY protein